MTDCREDEFERKGGRLPPGPPQHDSHVQLWRLARTIAIDVASYGSLLRYEYSQDVGNLHVIDYHLWLADLPIRRPGCEAPRALRFSPADWSRP